MMTDIFKIASIGMNEKQAFFFNQLLKLYGHKLSKSWRYLGDFNPENVIETMGSVVKDAHLLLMDIDTEEGKRAWYILQVLFDEDNMIALTNSPQISSERWTLQKPKINWSASDGVAVVSILNELSNNYIKN